MLTVPFLRENKELAIAGLKKKNFKQVEIIDEIIACDDQRKKIQFSLDSTLQEMNSISKSIGILLKDGKKDEAEQAKIKTADLKEAEKKLKTELSEIEIKLQELLYQVPNLPHASVPFGKTPEENETIFENNFEVQLPQNALPHWDLAKKYNLIDFELGVKITGAGFPVYLGKGARLQRALIQFFLDYNSSKNYVEVIPPFVVNEASGYGTGQLPDKEGQMYFVGEDNLYLIPTSEVPVTNIYRDVLLNENQFPIKNTSYSPCFRREAGSYGKDVRGLNRLHQFEKVEIVRIEKPENSYQALEEMVELVKGLMNELELPYRILKLCGGDMSFASALTYDFEVWSAAQEKWLEVSSVSNFENFQANRLKLRYKSDGKNVLCHTLNGSALALPRILAALLENNQTEDGIKIPKVLQSYTGFDLI
jgi:seryl-tRNA synthetase